MTTTNITRNKAIEGLENYGLFQPFLTAGKYEIPVIAPVYELPQLKWIDFSAARSFRGNGKEVGVHFFTDDYRFNSVWLQAAKSPMETMTKGRVYVTVNSRNEPKAITYFDKNNKRYKQIDISGKPHLINGKYIIPHIHKGYEHNEKGNYALSPKEQKMLDRVIKTWYNYLSGKQ